MLTIRAPKNLHGKFDLPPSPDCCLLAAVVGIARKQTVRIIPAPQAPVLYQWAEALKTCGTMELADNEWLVKPEKQQSEQPVVFRSVDLPYRDLIVFTLLGMDKTVAFNSISEKRCNFWQEQTKRLGCKLDIQNINEYIGLKIEDPSGIKPPPDVIEETDVQPLLGLLLGSSAVATFTTSSPLISPLRTIASQFGYRIEVKSSAVRERNEVARRLQIMRQKAGREPVGQQFIVNADFSLRGNEEVTQPVAVTLPGDELAGALLTAAQCFFPKSSLIIDNVPLESWAMPVAAFIRKMGCKVSVQETGSTSFGSTGLLKVQSTGLSGRKMDCIPAVQYAHFLPAMTVIASFAEGETVLRGIGDLRLDEPDGVKVIESCMEVLGVRHGEMPDGIIIKGEKNRDGFDHPALLPAPHSGALAIAALRCMGTSTVNEGLLLERMPYFETMLNSICEYRN